MTQFTHSRAWQHAVSSWLWLHAGNASSAKEVQSFVLDAFTNDVERLTEDILPIFMSSSPDRPKVRRALCRCRHRYHLADVGVTRDVTHVHMYEIAD